MRRRVHAPTLVLIACLAGSIVRVTDGPRDVIVAFGTALTSGKAHLLRPLLPTSGRIRLSLSRLGPEEGLFASGQVEALFQDFLSSSRVVSFEIVRSEGDGKHAALVHAAAAIVERDGRQVKIGFHFALQPEGERWVLREVKETSE